MPIIGVTGGGGEGTFPLLSSKVKKKIEDAFNAVADKSPERPARKADGGIDAREQSKKALAYAVDSVRNLIHPGGVLEVPDDRVVGFNDFFGSLLGAISDAGSATGKVVVKVFLDP